MVFLLFLAGCGGTEKTPETDKPPENAKVHALKGKIISRDANAGTLTIAHEAIPGAMEAMTMPFPVRGAKLEDLPADGTMIEATLHLAEMSYWITDVRESPPKP